MFNSHIFFLVYYQLLLAPPPLVRPPPPERCELLELDLDELLLDEDDLEEELPLCEWLE